MKKNLLFSLLLIMVSAFSMAAGNVRIIADTPANVTVTTNGGYGRTLDLGSGNANFTDLTVEDSPLVIEPTPGATIESVEVNGNTHNPSGDGKYRVGVSEGGMMINITTSGQGSGGDTVKMVAIAGFSAVGDGVSGTPFTVTYDKDGEWVAPEVEYGLPAFPENSTVKITPEATYDIANLTFRDGTEIETARLEDGSVTFVCSFDKFYYQNIYVNLTVKEGAVKFSIDVDFAPNLSAALENQRQGSYDFLKLVNGINNFVCLPENSPLEFFATEGAEIASLTRNGEPCGPIGMGAGLQWVYDVADGDSFVVTTIGKPVSVALHADDGYAPLEAYTFTDSNGNTFSPEGMDAIIQTTNGEIITVAPRPGTELELIYTVNGGDSDYASLFRASEGSDGVNPMTVNIMGKRTITGVVIKVDDADRVRIVQEGGRGDVLEVATGKNEFKLEDLKNALAVSAAPGNQMTAVNINGKSLAPNADAVYLVNVAEGDLVDILSRKNPVDCSLTFNFGDAGDVSWLKANVDGMDVVLNSPFVVRTYTEMILSAVEGYDLLGVSSEVPGVNVRKVPGSEKYIVTVEDADVTAADISVVMKEVEPDAGNAVVIPNGEDIFIRYSEYAKDSDGNYKYVKTLENNTVNQVAVGHYVEVFCKDTQSRFRYVRANGEDVELDESYDCRRAYVLIEDRTVIDAEIFTPCLVYTNESYDDVKNIVSGRVYFKTDGGNVNNLYVEAGQTVKLVAEPAPGYVFDHFERYFSTDVEGFALDGDEYTFSAEDVTNNFILFKGVFQESPDESVYVVRGATAWLADAEGNPVSGSSSAMGTVVFVNHAGEYVAEYSGFEGDEIGLAVAVSDESVFNEYEVMCYCFSDGFPNNKIAGSTYVISGDDANKESVIWISALIRKKDGGSVDSLVVDGKLLYHAAEAKLYSPAPVKVFDLKGNLVLDSEDTETSLESIPAGLYVAVSGNSVLKFIR